MKEITTDVLTDRLVSGEKITVLDIRETDEFDDWHIAGSSNLPIYNAINAGRQDIVTERLQRAAGESLDKGASVAVVCRAGNTSRVAADMLESMGFDAFSLMGGMLGWSSSWTEAHVPLSTAKDSTLFQVRRNGKGCLSYLFGSDGVAAVVDPCVDVSVYTSIAQREGFEIKWVLETHVHADHVSRARALCERTGAALCIPKNERCQFEYTALEDGQTVRIGKSTVTVIHTPGHTGESVCYDLDGEVLLTGDTLFVENIGRPDLEKGDEGAEAGARLLYDSLHDRVFKMSDEIRICPGHTSSPIGFDGTAISATLGHTKSSSEFVGVDRERFAKLIPELLSAKPPNFERVISVNEGRTELGYLDPLELEAGPNRCAVK